MERKSANERLRPERKNYEQKMKREWFAHVDIPATSTITSGAWTVTPIAYDNVKAWCGANNVSVLVRNLRYDN